MSEFLVLFVVAAALVCFCFCLVMLSAMDDPSTYEKRFAECQSNANIKIDEVNGKRTEKNSRALSKWSSRLAMKIDMLSEH